MELAFLENRKLIPNYTGLKRVYHVKYFFLEEEKNSIQYKVEVSCIKKINAKGHVLQISRSNYKINNHTSERIIEKMAFQAGEILNSLQLLVDFRGNIRSIYNIKTIQNKWHKEIKEHIKKNFSGKYVNKYIQLIEECLRLEDKLIEKISNDWFLSIYFMTLYKDNKGKVKINKYFPIIIDAKQVKYQTTFLEEEYSDERLMKIKIEGLLNDPRSKMDFQNKTDYPYFPKVNGEETEGYCMGTFLLNKQKKTIWKAEINLKIFLKESSKRIHVFIESLEPPDELINEMKDAYINEEKEYEYYLEKKKRKNPFLELIDAFFHQKK